MATPQSSVNTPDSSRIESDPQTQQDLTTLRSEVEESSLSSWESFKAKITEKIREIVQSIDLIRDTPFLRSLFADFFDDDQADSSESSEEIDPENRSRGLTLDQANEFASQHEALLFMNDSRFSLTSLYNRARQINRAEPVRLTHNFNALNSQKYFPHNNGQLTCAHYISTVLGISAEEGSVNGSIGSVSNLVPFLMRKNMDKNNGNPGIIFGYENMMRGDVIVFKGNERYGHVGIVRDTFTYKGVKYLAMQHSSTSRTSIRVEIIPISPADARTSDVEAAFNNPTERSRIPALQSIHEYRGRFPDTVGFRANSGFYGDPTVDRSERELARRQPRAAFAVRTM